MGSIGFSIFSPKLHRFSRGTTVAAAAGGTTNSNLAFKSLMESFTVDIHRAEGRELNVPLIAPFTIATSKLEDVRNVAIRVELSNGCCGWGEAPVLPFVTAENQSTALEKAGEACQALKKSGAMSLGDVLGQIGHLLPGHDFASVGKPLNISFL
ncbi:hypothetical protein SSX86_032444 [Deinandra increscens subsp. villosa]|uniref:L-Ala-D/L-Glu epimerase n=1 Tax=Deinandra increscens subsp. villosa TaxID=3103831 RepID=A0AAP0C471_9ASTR